MYEQKSAENLNKIKKLEYGYYNSKSDILLHDLFKEKMKFNEESSQLASAYLLRQNSRYYGGQNKSGKLLTNYLKIKQERKRIHCIKNTNNILLTKYKEILKHSIQIYIPRRQFHLHPL